MAILTTAKYALRYPDLAEMADVPAYIGDLAADTDTTFAGYSITVNALRPAAGKAGRIHYSSDTDAMYLDDGAVWHGVALTSDSRLADQRVPLDSSVTTAKLAASTGTGNVVLSANPTLTGTVTTAVIQATTITLSQNNSTALSLSGATAGFTIDGDIAFARNAAGKATLTLSDRLLITKTGDTTEQFGFEIDGGGAAMPRIRFGPGGVTNADTFLWREAAAQLKTAAIFLAGTDIYARHGLATQVRIGDTGGAVPGVIFGNAGDTILYRSAAGVVATDGQLSAGTYGLINTTLAAASQMILGMTSGSIAGSGIRFGGDTFFYRSGAAILKTDGQLWAVSDVVGRYNTASQVILGDVGGKPGLSFGTAVDTNLYRGAAGELWTDSYLRFNGLGMIGQTGGALTSAMIYGKHTGDAEYAFLLSFGGKMQWGPGGATTQDTFLARGAAAVLQTNSIQIVSDAANHGYLELQPITAGASSGTAHVGRLQVVVNGGGKGELRCYWPGGGFTVVTTEP